MVSKKEIIDEFNRVSSLKNILETYEQIAASRMRSTRSSVLQGRDFITELNNVFQEVKRSYKDEVQKLMKKDKVKDPTRLTFTKRNGKTLFVLLSSNTGLYGDIIGRTFNLFAELVTKEPCDAVIIGRLGLEFFKAANLKIPYAYFDLPDSMVDSESVKKIVSYLIQYERIFIVYEQFENVVSQKPIVINISGDSLPQKSQGPSIKYFFEPTLGKIMMFFEKEIFASLFEQTIFESQLAKFASRMTSLEERVENIEKLLKQMSLEKAKAGHRTMNKKQLETFSGIALWNI